MTEHEKVWSTDWLTTSAQYLLAIGYRISPGASSPHDEIMWGKPLPDENLPQSFYLLPHRRQKSKRKDYIVCEGMAQIISPRFADLLRKFDLGAPEELGPGQESVQLHPVPLFDTDETTKLGDYVFLNVATKKSALVSEQSERLHGGPGSYAALSYDKDGQFTLTKASLAGPDMWRDQAIMNCIFVSDRLKRAMEDAKIKPVKFLASNLVEAA